MARTREFLLPFLACLAAVATVASGDIETRIRNDWRQLIKVCPNRIYQSCATVDKSSWTDAKRTRRLDMLEVQGRWLTFKFETYDQKGDRKTRGGDSWFFVLRDLQQKISFSTRVFDEGDGTYTVAAVIHTPGNFSVLGRLWYSDCHGVQEPAKTEFEPLIEWYNWLQPKDHCHIGTRIRLKGIVIEPGNAAIQTCATCQAARKVPVPGVSTVTRSDYYVYRKDGHLHFVDCCKPREFQSTTPKRVFMCGDSTMRQQWNFYLWTARRPCRWDDDPRWMEELFTPDRCPNASLSDVDPELNKVYRRCTGGPDWSTVPIGVIHDSMLEGAKQAVLTEPATYTYNSSFHPAGQPVPREFTVSFMDGWGTLNLRHVKEMFLNPLREDDMFIINSGPHPSRTQTFQEFQAYISSYAAELYRIKTTKKRVTVLWRSSNIWKEHVFRNATDTPYGGYIATGHFNTFLRGQFFDSFAEDVMRFHGIDVWDVYTITSAGTNRPWDMIHVDAHTVRTLDLDMLDQFACKV